MVSNMLDTKGSEGFFENGSTPPRKTGGLGSGVGKEGRNVGGAHSGFTTDTDVPIAIWSFGSHFWLFALGGLRLSRGDFLEEYP